MAKENRIVIIGAGLAGLTAGIDLAKAGRKVIILEKEDGVGGHAASWEENGYIYDIGHHVIHPLEPILDMVKVAGIEEDLVYFDLKLGFMRDKRVHTFSPSPLSALTFRLLGFRDKLKLGKLMSGAKDLSEKDYYDVTVEEFITERVSKKALYSFFEPLITRLSGVPPHVASATFLIAFLKQMGEMKGKLSYPRQGMGELPRGLASALTSQGGSIKVNSEITKIEVDGDRVSGMTYVEDEEKKEMETSTVVSTIPFKDLPNIVDLPREYRDRLKKIEYTEFISAYFGLDSRITEQDFMVLVPQKEGFSLTSFTEVSNISKDLAPNGKSLFTATGTSHTISETNDEKVLDLFIEDLNSLFPGYEEKINWKKPIRMPYIAITKEYPLMKPDFTSPIKGLYIAGSQMFPTPTMPEAIVSGHTVSDLITQNLFS